MNRALSALSLGFLVTAFAAIAAGCSSPTTDPWRADEYTVNPSLPQPLDQGFLVVDTPFRSVRDEKRLEEIAERHYASYELFDGTGRFVRRVGRYMNEFPPKIPLASGNYILECELDDHDTRRVQVVVAVAQTTRVRLQDILAGQAVPEHD